MNDPMGHNIVYALVIKKVLYLVLNPHVGWKSFSLQLYILYAFYVMNKVSLIENHCMFDKVQRMQHFPLYCASCHLELFYHSATTKTVLFASLSQWILAVTQTTKDENFLLILKLSGNSQSVLQIFVFISLSNIKTFLNLIVPNQMGFNKIHLTQGH